MQLACWNFHTLEKPETKRERERERSLQDFGGFEQRGGGTKGKQEGADNVSRASCALCRLFCPFLILFPTRHTSADSAEKRSWRDPEGIPAVESMDAKDSLPDTHTLSLPLSLSLSLCACLFLRRNRAVFAFIFDYLARSPLFFVSRLLFPLFLSFNLRLDCRLHIVPSLPFTGLFLTSVHFLSHPYSFSPTLRF